jgi:hypothetical protein
MMRAESSVRTKLVPRPAFRSAMLTLLRCLVTGRKPGEFLFAGRDGGLTTRQYARLVREWIASIGLDPLKYGTG